MIKWEKQDKIDKAHKKEHGKHNAPEWRLKMEREKLGSRLGFILLSAGCAIGIGNVWRFPYITGRYGGGAFVLFYLFFLVIMGLL